VRVVVKVGTSSLTDESGRIATAPVEKLADEVSTARNAGHQVVVVSSGAISAGLPVLGWEGRRPTDMPTLQAVAAVGQHQLMATWDAAFRRHDLIAGQILLAPLDFGHRQQYLHARQTLERLLELGVVPVVNENDAVADDEIRFGDNDRLAALVAHLLRADLLVLLTDTPGLYTGDPRHEKTASLIEEVLEVDASLEGLASGPGSERGSGGMASKLAAAKIAAWSGVRAVIAAATRQHVLADAIEDVTGVGTVFRPRTQWLPARKLWIAFALPSSGTVVVDDGARTALVERGRSLLPAGVVKVEGAFEAGAAVEIKTETGGVFAKGIAGHAAASISAWAGRRTDDLPPDVDPEIVHRDDLVVLPGQ
jgi:glutamate 5-kinase